MRHAAAILFAFAVMVTGCSEPGTDGAAGNGGTGASGGTGGMGGEAGSGGGTGTGGGGGSGAAGTGGNAGTGGDGGSGGTDLCDGVDCDDGNDCTADECDGGACSNTPRQDGQSCDAGGFPGQCDAGVCFGLCFEVDCDDDNECTDDVCNRVDGGCDHTNRPNGAECDFGGLPGRCDAGSCVDAELCGDVDCSDGNECTDDVCSPIDASCTNPNKPDRSLCSDGEHPGLCASGVCEGLCENVDCDDGNECTLTECDRFTGACPNPDKPNGTTCDFDGLPGRCASGLCVGLCSGVTCDDGNECTDDVCDPNDGLCDYVAVADDSPCANDVGRCVAGRCVEPPRQIIPIVGDGNGAGIDALAGDYLYENGGAYTYGDTQYRLGFYDLDYEGSTVDRVELCEIDRAFETGFFPSGPWSRWNEFTIYDQLTCVVGGALTVNDFCEEAVALPGFHFDTTRECFELPAPPGPGRAYTILERDDRPDRLGVFVGVITELDQNWPSTKDYRHRLIGSEVRVTFAEQP